VLDSKSVPVEALQRKDSEGNIMIWTKEHDAKLKQYLETHTLSVGLGTEESACSLAAINLATSGELTDKIPDCMSEVLGRAINSLQDAIHGDMRNSARYRAMLQRAPGTGRDKEQERLEVLLEWVWGTVLPKLQPMADNNGFGDKWRTMCEKRTFAAAEAAAYAALYAAYCAASIIGRNNFWEEIDPIGVLERMIEV